ncbi:hydroxyisourate hydrolase-like [Cicer arietinum]|uniref:hydroxyisourate hydrolase-like n=1 Tax=Cicer arietinum TaxID=3827 RepID=UPI003CC604C8
MVLTLKIFALLVVIIPNAYSLSIDDFPSDFVFGASTSAYQVQQMKMAENQAYGILFLIMEMEDVQLMANMGLDAYRFSISWSGIIPDGKGPINPK